MNLKDKRHRPPTCTDELTAEDLVNDGVSGLPAVTLDHGFETRADGVGVGLFGECEGLEDGSLGPQNFLIPYGFQEAPKEFVCVLLFIALELRASLAYLRGRYERT